ncbi:membrane protein [Chlamydia caviae]|uniref:Uncharacterized protein n=1 Tax=Chlamydia caviae (strain ATCC VR-813 / DSM 19441 / 03DC25 / GPIC) TaxID=227941 RepID=Q822V3_CHLCV|nr:membrane protein [Chlamydia caviae]AAP05318.1 conserved hypothetical protein [Chlamydia caviae GPIC]
MSNPIPTQRLNISSFHSITSHTLMEGNFSPRRASLRLFLDTMLIVLGFSTVVSIFVAIFFLNGLSMLNTTTIVLSVSLILMGIIFISIGVLFFVNNIEQGLSGILKKRLSEAESEIKDLRDQLQNYELNLAFAPSEDRIENSENIEPPASTEVPVETIVEIDEHMSSTTS